MKTIFFGTPETAVPFLRLLAKRTQVLAVVSQPDRPSGRGLEVAPTPVKAAALELKASIAGGDYKHPDQDGPNLAFTDDGGLTWKLSTIAPQSYFSAVGFTKPDSGRTSVLAVGTTRAAFAEDIAKPSWQKTWDLNLNALSTSPTGNAIAVGPKGLIVNFAPVR